MLRDHRRPSVAELRSAAMALTGHGWPVLRGTYRRHDDGLPEWVGRSDAVGLRPVDDDWPTTWTLRTVEVVRWWQREPYSVLVACGHGVDCVEVPAPAGHPASALLRAAQLDPPAMVTPVETVVLFVGTHRGQRPVVVSGSLRSAGSWVAIPPTDGYHWLRAPGSVGWRLPELRAVSNAVRAAAVGHT